MFGSVARCVAGLVVLSASACASSRQPIPIIETGTCSLAIVGEPRLTDPAQSFNVTTEGHFFGDVGLPLVRCEGDLTSDERQRLTAAVNRGGIIVRSDGNTSCRDTDCEVFHICITWMDDPPHCFAYAPYTEDPGMVDFFRALGAVTARLYEEGACDRL